MANRKRRASAGSFSVDRRSMRAGQSLRQHFPFIAHTGVPHSDPEGVGLFYNSLIASTVSFEVGLVTMAMPTINCYRVQLASLDQSILCGHATFSSGYPFGAKEIDVIPTGAEVLVCRDKLRPYGTIVTILPVPHNRAQLYNQGDLIFPGFVSGLYREPCYSEAITRISKESNLYDFSGHRPRDMTTAGERGWMTPSGVFITINDKEACLGVNELCGLFCSRYDTYARLAGWNMDWETVSHQRQIRLDQGETFDVEGFSPYYWEGLGFYEPGQATTQEFDGQEIVFGNRPLAHYDLPENDRDRVPYWRQRTFRGYLGQGELRVVTIPPREPPASNKLSTEADPPIGVFRQFIGNSGAYVVQSAKEILFVKRGLMAVPIQRRVPEDAKDGDGTEGGYRFAGIFGGGPIPKLDEWIGRDDEYGPFKTASASKDIAARLFNWIMSHPFAMHVKDWELPEESDGNGPLTVNAGNLDFSAIKSGGRIPGPTPKTAKVDHLQPAVTYFENESRFHQTDDGSIVAADGFGARITMSQGKIFLDAPGGVHIRSGGTSSIEAGDDLILKARQSIDLTATEQNITQKAERNYTVLAGNDGSGGLSFESRGTGIDVDKKGGENATLAGILFRSTQGPFAVHAGEVYLRTGGDGIAAGPITLDANKGAQSIVMTAQQHRRYGETFIDSFGTAGSVRKVNFFAENGATLSSALSVSGTVISLAKGVSFVGAGSVAVAAGGFASPKGGMVGPIEASQLTDLKDSLQTARQQMRTNAQDLTKSWRQEFRDRLYKEPTGYGSKAFQQGFAFSFRDDPEGLQYATQNYLTPEPEWFRLAEKSGYVATPWKERPTTHPILKELYPYPGGKALKGPTLLRFESVLLKDEPGDIAVDRGEDGGPYRSPSLADSVKPVILNDNWKGA